MKATNNSLKKIPISLEDNENEEHFISKKIVF
jgi:hypothetical protein